MRKGKDPDPQHWFSVQPIRDISIVQAATFS